MMNNFYLLLHATPRSYVRVVAPTADDALRVVNQHYSPHRWHTIVPEEHFDKTLYPLGEMFCIHSRNNNQRVLKVS